MTVTISPQMFPQFFNQNNSGSPAIGYKLFTYIAGTSTKQNTWTDSTQTVLNANPIILDSNGIANVWLDPTLTYKYVLALSTDTDPPSSPLRTVDNISSAITNSAMFSLLQLTQTPAELAAGVIPTNQAYFAQPWLWVRREGCVLDGSTDDSTSFGRCLSVASTTNMALVIDAPCYLNSNITVPQNVQLVFAGNGKLKPGSGKTITLGQTPQAGLWQIFDVSSGGTILMPAGNAIRTMEVWGEWWGANGDGSTNIANEVPINAAIGSVGYNAGGIIRLGAGLFYISGVINLSNYCTLKGLNDFTKIKAQSGWSGGSIMIAANNGTSPIFDSRLEYLTIDGNSKNAITTVVQSTGWQQRCGIFNCEIQNFQGVGFQYLHGYGGAAVLKLENSDFFPNDVNGGIGAQITNDGTVGWLKLNIDNCTFASTGTGANSTYGLQLCTGEGGRIVCDVQGVDFEVLQYGVVLDQNAVLCGSGFSGGGQTPAIAGNALIRALATWTAGSGQTGSINITGVKLGGWTNMIVDSNRTYACAALEPYDGVLAWPPNLWRPVGTCYVTGGATPALSNSTSFGVCSKAAGASIAHTAAGEQTLTLSTTMDTSADIICKATSNDFGAPQISVNVTSATTIQIYTKSPTGVATDSASFILDIFHTP